MQQIDTSPREISSTFAENFTVDEFGRFARVSRTTVYRAIRDGQLVAHKLRGRTIIRRVDAESFVGGTRIN